MKQAGTIPMRQHGLNVQLLLRAIERWAVRRGFKVESYGRAGGYPLISLSRHCRNHPDTARIYVSTGMHGDEPGGPLALLAMLRNDEFARDFSWSICPVLNPVGLERGTRENGDGLDMNRDYHYAHIPAVMEHIIWLSRQPVFDLALLMHEDWETGGFYINEFKTGPMTHLDEQIISSVATVCPIEPSGSIDEMPARGGIVHPFRGGHFGENWPESFFLRNRGVSTGFNFEAPSCLPLATRIRAFRTALHEAVGAFRDGSRFPE